MGGSVDDARRASALKLAVVLLVLALAGVVAVLEPAEAAPRPSIAAYRGLGSWVDVWDTREWNNPAATLNAMKSREVRTLYLQTSNYSRDRAIVYRKATERFIHSAHARGMRVVAWYLPGFNNMKRDRTRMLAALRFRTSKGQRFDSFALDIEASIVKSQAVRNRRLLRLSRILRKKAGPRYPLGAIIPSPRGMQLVKGYWETFPYRKVAAYYDVFVPMGYYSYRTSTEAAARAYTQRNFRIIRNKTGRPGIPIHSIGGIADDSTGAEVRGFVRAVREHGGLGASVYAFNGTKVGHWNQLARVPVNPRQKIPLPRPLRDDRSFGNIPGGDRSHPKEVSYRAGGMPGDRVLSFSAFDVQAGEVKIYVNWKLVGEVSPTVPDDWSPVPEAIPIGGALLKDNARNHVQFVASGDHPSWSTWGVRDVTLA